MHQAMMEPATQVLINKVSELSRAAGKVVVEQENFQLLGDFLDVVKTVAVELQNGEDTSHVLEDLLESLVKPVERAQELITFCTNKSRIYLLLHCRQVAMQLEEITRSMGRSLSQVPVSCIHEGGKDTKGSIDSLAQEMEHYLYPVKENEARLCQTLERENEGILSYPAVQTGILMDIARTVGIEDLSQDPSAFRSELELLKQDVEESQNDEDLHMMDLIGNMFEIWLQSNAQPSLSDDTQTVHPSHKRLEPLYDTFICPLTKQVMQDPVTIDSGQTYERSAINRWFQECLENGRPTVCPITGQQVQTTLKPSLALRNTIDEWTSRNEQSRVDIAGQLISAADSSKEDVLFGLNDLQALCHKNRFNKYCIRSSGLIPVIENRLKNGAENGVEVRCTSLATLCLLVEDDDDNKDVVGETDLIRLAIKCLSRDLPQEREAAVALLSELSKSYPLCEKIGATNGAILLLVGMLSNRSQNLEAICYAEQTLNNLECCDKCVRQMAENGRIQPLLTRLVEGSDDLRIEMAEDLATVPLTSEDKAKAAKTVTMTLVEMLGSNSPAAQAAALKALCSLSTLESNGSYLIEAGVLTPLMHDLFLVGPNQVSRKLKEVSASTLANIVNSSGNWQTIPIDADGNTLTSKSVVHNFLQLINNTGPAIMAKLLQVLVGLASSPQEIGKVVSHIRSAGATVSLIQFLEAPHPELRVTSVKLLFLLSTHMGEELADGLRVTTRQLSTLLRLLRSDNEIAEQAAAAGLLANLPVQDLELTHALLDEGALPVLINRIEDVRRGVGSIGSGRYMAPLQSRLVAILSRFTYALDDKEIQALATDLPQSKGVFLEWLGCVKRPSLPPGLCPVHGGICSATETFCLREANAVVPLVSLLDHNDLDIVEAALGALSTLIMDTVDLKQGSQVLLAAGAIQPILNILLEHQTEVLRERAMWMMERILRNGDLAQRIMVDTDSQTAIVDAFQHGNNATRQLAEKALKHLNKIPTVTGVFLRV
ncbi:unnamed protein product [Sphagnum jensenii]|uniref:RING-type E3 ubiquitin transferase n=1 Tax=Sphagnum jensenii TaxID=128206 RepID=A0ABP1AL14_9BRYO